MSNIIAFPVDCLCDVAKPGNIDVTNPQEKMEGVRDQIEDVLVTLVAILEQLVSVGMPSAPLSEAANFNLSTEQGRKY